MWENLLWGDQAKTSETRRCGQRAQRAISGLASFRHAAFAISSAGLRRPSVLFSTLLLCSLQWRGQQHIMHQPSLTPERWASIWAAQKKPKSPRSLFHKCLLRGKIIQFNIRQSTLQRVNQTYGSRDLQIMLNFHLKFLHYPDAPSPACVLTAAFYQSQNLSKSTLTSQNTPLLRLKTPCYSRQSTSLSPAISGQTHFFFSPQSHARHQHSNKHGRRSSARWPTNL